MTWILLAISTAFFESLRDVFYKKSLQSIDEYLVSWSSIFFTVLFLIPSLFFIEIPSLDKPFWIALLIGGVLNTIAYLIFVKALKTSDLSKIAPLTTFTPLFLLITSPFIVGEFPNHWGVIGIVFIVLGSYVLNLKQKNKGYLYPFQALLKETGSRLILIVAFLWSITSNFDKVGVQNSSPIFWIISVYACIALLMFPVMFQKSQTPLQQIKQNWKKLILIGLFNAITVACQMTALTLTLVAYVIAVKRTSGLFSVLFGYLIFNEKGIRERFAGSVIMVFGVLFITMSQIL